jgi:transposase
MGSASKRRRTWTKLQKLFFMLLLENPEYSKSIREVSKEYGISKKVLYEWQKNYAENGEKGFEPKPKRPYPRKFEQQELIDRICNLSLLHPDWSARKLIEYLKSECGLYPLPSIPTMLRILHEQRLGRRKQRFAASERSFLEGKIQLPQTSIDMLVRHNPLLKLLETNRRVRGNLFFLEAVPLSSCPGETTGHVLLAVESHSLHVFGRYGDDINLSDLETFVTEVKALGGGRYMTRSYFVAENGSVFTKALKLWLAELSPSERVDYLSINLEKAHFKAVMEPFRSVLNSFLKTYQFTDAQQFQSDLNQLLIKHAASTKHIGYPCFGEEPHVVHKYYRENLYFEVTIKTQC